MSRISPLQEGFLAAWRRPAVVLAEVAWRWTFGAAALALATASLLVYLSTLTVSRVELLALPSHTPWLIADAVVHILQGSGYRLLRIVLILTPAVMLLWIVAASLGRMATLSRLVRAPATGIVESVVRLMRLNSFRALLLVGSLVAYIGAAILAGTAANRDLEVRPGIFLLVFIGLAILISLARSRANWFPHLATIFVVGEGCTAAAALRRSAQLFGRRSADFVWAGFVFGLVHAFVAGAATLFTLAAIAMFRQVAAGLVIAVVTVITLTYFAVAEFLYVARLAAYVAIAEDDRASETAVPDRPQLLPPMVPEPPLPPEGAPA